MYLVCSGDVEESFKMTLCDVGRWFYDVQVLGADILIVCPSDSLDINWVEPIIVLTVFFSTSSSFPLKIFTLRITVPEV